MSDFQKDTEVKKAILTLTLIQNSVTFRPGTKHFCVCVCVAINRIQGKLRKSCAEALSRHFALHLPRYLSKFMTFFLPIFKTFLVQLPRFCERLMRMEHLRDFNDFIRVSR